MTRLGSWPEGVTLQEALEGRLPTVWDHWTEIAVEIIDAFGDGYRVLGEEEKEKAGAHCLQILTGEHHREVAYLKRLQAENPEELTAVWLEDICARLDVAEREALDAAERRIMQAVLRGRIQAAAGLRSDEEQVVK